MPSPIAERDSDLYWHVRGLVEDHDRGASAINADLRRHLVPFEGSPEDGREIARMLVAAKPVMAPILHLANYLLGGARPPEPVQGLGASGLALVSPQRARGAARDRQLEAAATRIVRLGPDRPLRVMTYSASGTVEAVLDALQERGALESVYLSEAQPGGEGRALAARLAAEWGPHDVDVLLTHDAALPALLPRVDILVIGADLVLEDGIVNKVGTSMLVERALRLGVPVVVCAAEDKAPPRGIRREHLPLPFETDAGQLSDPPTGVRTVGLAFEWIDVPARGLPEWVSAPAVPAARPDLLAMLSALPRA